MPPAARIGDMHVCPMIDPGPKPHVGGPVTLGCPTVMIGGCPASRMGDVATCVGPPDSIAKGSATVMIGNMAAARVGDPTAHGGSIVIGCPTVMIGDAGQGATGGGGGPSTQLLSAIATAQGAGAEAPLSTPQSQAMTEAAEEGTPMVEKCPFAGNH